MMKICNKCGISKPFTEFHKGEGIGGAGGTCKICLKERYKNRTPKEQADISSKVCFTCKQEKSIEDFSASPINRDGYSGSCKICNAEKTQRINKEHMEKDPRLFKLKMMLHGAKSRTKNTNIPCEITLDDLMPFYHLTHCSLIPSIELNWNNEMEAKKNSPSLDRIIPSLGYVKGNIQVISHKANIVKNNATEEELRHFIKSMRRDALEYFNIGNVNEEM